MEKILVVEDDADIQEVLKNYLMAEGYEVRLAEDGVEGLAAFQSWGPDLVLLDVMLPKVDGFAVLELIRKESLVPVLMVTARDSVEDQVRGFHLQADDYIPKPFSPQELVLRVCAVLRRCYPAQPDTLQLAACTLDLSNAEAIRPNGERVLLTVKERDILTALARNANRIVTSEALCDAAWGDSFGYGQSLMTHVRRIREKIEADPSHPASLVTAKGLGYKLVVQG